MHLPPFNPEDPALVRALKKLFIFYIAAAVLAVTIWFSYGAGNYGARDFTLFWSASKLSAQGQAELAYDSSQLSEASREAVPNSSVMYSWRYPPTALLLYMPLAWLPYNLSWVVFTLITTLFLLLVLRRIINTPLAFWTILASPALAFNSWNGQNGTLNAALLACALLTLVRRPQLSALSATLLACKPHLLPPLLLVELLKARKTLSLTLLAIFASAGLATLVFGPSLWNEWLGTMPTQYTVEQSDADTFTLLERMASVFAAMRLAGLSVTASLIIHAAVAILALGMLMYLWSREHISFDRKAAALPLAILLFPPYLFYYDYVLVLPALAYWMRHLQTYPAKHGELHLMALLWALPVWLGCTSLHAVPLPQIILLGALYYLMRRRD
jgi:hypothetical protein